MCLLTFLTYKIRQDEVTINTVEGVSVSVYLDDIPKENILPNKSEVENFFNNNIDRLYYSLSSLDQRPSYCAYDDVLLESDW